MTSECVNPYPGPESFGRGDVRPYFGRDQETSDLTSMAVTERLMVFYAPSGAGKTSLLNMRLIPRLEEKLYEVLPMARVSGMATMPASVRNVYTYNLMLRLAPGDAHPERFAQLSLSDFLWHLSTEDGKSYHYDPSDQALRRATPVRDLWPRVLILDQFEEIVTAYPVFWRHREDFFRQLDEALASDAMLRVIMSLRADYVQDLERYAGLLQHGLRARYQMFLMDTDDAHLAIEGPAKACRRPLGAGVAQQLVRNMSQIRGQDALGKPHFEPGETVEPIQLQVVCYQLWESMKGTPGDTIEMKDLRRLAREAVTAQAGSGELTQRQQYEALSAFVDGALGAFYETALKKALASAAAPVDEALLRDWFSSKLITDGGTRGFMQRGHDDTGGVPEEVVQKLVDNHLLRSDTRGSARLVELIHDRFVEPILRFNQRWSVDQLQRDPLLRRAHEWAASNHDHPDLRDQRLLLTDDELATLDLAGRTQGPVLHDFLEASQQAKKDRDLAAARQQEQAALRRAKTARQRQLVLSGLVILALLASIIAVRQTGAANSAASAAVAAQTVSAGNAATALVARREADTANKTSRSLMLANQSLNNTGSPEDRLLLAHAATEISPTLLAYTALLSALDTHAPLAGGSATTGAPSDSGDADPSVESLSQASEFVSVLPFTAPVSPTLQAVSPGGRWLAVAQDGSAVWLGEAVDAAQPISISVPAGIVITAAALSDDGAHVAWASCLSRPAAGSPTPTQTAGPDEPTAPTAAGNPTATATPSAKETPTPTKTPATPTGAALTGCRLTFARAGASMMASPGRTIPAPEPIVAVAFRPQQADQGAMALESGVIQTFDGAATKALTSGVKKAVDIAFSSDGDYLAALNKEGQVSLWAWAGDEPVELHEPGLGGQGFAAIEFVQGDAWLALAVDPPAQPSQAVDPLAQPSQAVDPLAQPSQAVDPLAQPSQAQVALWDRQTKSLVHRFDLGLSVADLALSADGSTLLAALPGFTMRWPMEPARWLELACARAGRNLSYDAWRKAFPDADRDNPENARICDLPLDISFAQALVDEAERTLDDCRSGTLEFGMALLEKAQQADARLNLDPSAHMGRVLGGQALEEMRDGDDEQARECLGLVAAEQASFDPAQAFQAASSLVQAERLLAGPAKADMAAVVAALDQALELSPHWPDRQVEEMARRMLPDAIYSLCQQGDAQACQRLTSLAVALEEGTRVAGELVDGAGPALLFQGQRGQVVTIAMNADNNAFDTLLRLEGPAGALISDDDTGPENNSLIANYLLPSDGIYRIIPAGFGGGGSGAYTVQFDLGATRPITPGMVETSTTAQDSLWQFQGQAGQLLGIRMDTADASFDPYLILYGPDSTQIVVDDDSGGVWNALIVATLPEDGSYTLNTGRPDSSAPYTLRVIEPRPLPFDQPQTSTTLSDTLWLFEVAGSPVIGLEITTAGDAMTPQIALRDANGAWLSDGVASPAQGQARIPAYVLPAGERFIVQVTPEGGPVPYTLTLTSLAAPALALDQPVTSTTQANPIWTFTGQAGQIVDISLSSDRLTFDPELKLLDAGGGEVIPDYDGGGNLNARIAAFILPADGQYFVRALPAGSPVSYTLALSSVTPQAVTSDEGEKSSTLRQDTLWAFDGRLGQPIAFNVSTPTGAVPTLAIQAANGEMLVSPQSGAITAFFPLETGRYFLRVADIDQTTSYDLALQELEPPAIAFGEPVTSTTQTNELWRFAGQAGQVVTTDMTGWIPGGFDPYVYLLADNGRTLDENDDVSTDNYNARIAASILPADGDYFLRAGSPSRLRTTDPYTVSLQVTSPPEIRFDQPASSNTQTDEMWRFSGQAGQVVDIELTGSDFDPYLTLYAGDGSVLAANDNVSLENLNARIAAFILPTTGDFYIRAGQPGSTAPYWLSLTARQSTPAVLDSTVQARESTAFALPVQRPGFVSIAVDPAAELTLAAPDGMVLAGQAPAILARLNTTGVYTLAVNFPVDGQPRTVSMLPIAATARALDATQSNQGRLRAGNTDLWTLAGGETQAVRVTASGTGFTPVAALYAPDGTPLAVSDPNGMLAAVLPAAGDSVLSLRGLTDQASGPYTLTVQPINAMPGPQACSPNSSIVSYLPVRQGSRVILGRHRPVNGEASWNPGMDAYVGQQAIVTGLAGNDGLGCPVVFVDIDRGQNLWRVRDMAVVE